MKFLLSIFLLLSCNVFAQTSEIPAEILYPQYLKNRDEITYSNVKNELMLRFRAYKVASSELPFQNCYKMQKRLLKALQLMNEETVPIPEINDETAFGENSPIKPFMKLMVNRPNLECSFASYNDDKSKIPLLYCKYHGLERDMHNDFAKKYIGKFKSSRPYINAFDVAEFILFLPAFIVFAVTMLIMKKMIRG